MTALEIGETANPFSGVIKIFKSLSGAEYGSILINNNNAEGHTKWRYTDAYKQNSIENTILIPDEYLSRSLKRREVLYFTKDSADKRSILPLDFPLAQLLIIPSSGRYLDILVIIGQFSNDRKIYRKRKVMKLFYLLRKNEQFLYFLDKYDKALVLSLRDDLTKAYNRRYLDKCLREELNRATRNNSRLSFIFFDLNDFRNFNDNYGHYYGSRLLVYITHKIMENVRDIDKFVRYGGDEFCVILPDTAEEGAEIVAKRILDVLHTLDFPTPDGRKIKLSACFGISSYPKHAKNVKDLICEADRAMYAAKEKGESIIIITDDISQRMRKRNIDV